MVGGFLIIIGTVLVPIGAMGLEEEPKHQKIWLSILFGGIALVAVGAIWITNI